MKRAIPLDLRHKLALAANRKLVEQIYGDNPLTQLFWECTLRCNLMCRHCGSDCRKESTVKDMPMEDFLKVIEEVEAAPENNPNKILIIFTGGEPLMRNDLEACGHILNKKGFPWGMVSNGYAMTQKRLDSLIDAGLHSITISLDGFEEDHDWMRNKKGSFLKAAAAVEMLAKTNLTYDVVTCVNKKTVTRLSEFKEYLISLGLKHWRLFTVFPVGRAAQDGMLSLSNEEFRTMLDFIAATRKEGCIEASYGCEGFLGNYEGDVRNNFYKCHAGVSVASVLADGSISACPSIRANFHQGNIYTDSFMDVWRNKYKPFRDRTWMKKDECADCKYFKHCQGNGMHLRDDNGDLILCHLKKLTNP